MPYASESMLMTAARESKKMWPLLLGISTVGYGVITVTANATYDVRGLARCSPSLRACRSPHNARSAMCSHRICDGRGARQAVAGG